MSMKSISRKFSGMLDTNRDGRRRLGVVSPHPMRASILAIFIAFVLSGCAATCSGPGCVDQLGWFSQCYGHRPQAERITTARLFDDGKPSLVWVHTTHERMGLPRDTVSSGYDQGWPYAESLMREKSYCDAGFERVTRRVGDREIPVVAGACSNVSFAFNCLRSQ